MEFLEHLIRIHTSCNDIINITVVHVSVTYSKQQRTTTSTNAMFMKIQWNWR